MSGALDEIAGAVKEIHGMVAKESQPMIGGSTSSIHIHGSAPGWMLAGIGIALFCGCCTVIMLAFYLAGNQRISDMNAQIAADRVIAAQQKTEADARARTDRLLLNKLEVAIAEKE